MKTILTSLLVAALVGVASSTPAADVPQPGTNTIEGLVRFVNADPDILARLGPPANEGISSFGLIAYTDPPDVRQTSKALPAADPISNPYAMTVSAEDVPLTYHVYAGVTLDGDREEYWTEAQTAAPLTSNSPPATVNFDECVALLQLSYQRADGSPVAAQGGRAWVTDTGTPYSLRARYLAQPVGRTENFLVVPSGVEVELIIEVDIGDDIYSNRITHRERQTFTLNCDERRLLPIILPAADTLGRIVGNANLVDEIELPTDGYEELLGRPVIIATGPFGNKRYDALAEETLSGDTPRAFELEDLVPSIPAETWSVHTEMHIGLGERFEFFRSPGLGESEFNTGVAVAAGETTDLGDTFVMTPARIVGKITLAGPPEVAGSLSALRGLQRAANYDPNADGIPDSVGATAMNGSYVVVSGIDELAPGATYTTAGGTAIASFAGNFNPATAAFEGDYVAAVGMLHDDPGTWKYDTLSLSIYHPGTNGGPYVDQQSAIVEDTPGRFLLGPGDRATNDIRYGMAEVCLRIRSPIPFYNPRVVNGSGGMTNLDGAGNVIRAYHCSVSSAYALPSSAETATYEAVVTFYLPEGSYTLQPAITTLDPDGGRSETQLATIEVSVFEGLRLCLEGPVRVVITPPVCSETFGFIARADAFSDAATLINLSLRSSPLSDPSIRLGYSDIRILEPTGTARTTLRTGHGLFPEFDGFADHMEYYEDILYVAEARDNLGRVATAQFVAHYDLTAPVLLCPGDMRIVTDDPAGAAVVYEVTATDNRPEPIVVACNPPSGTFLPPGTHIVTCTARDFCHNTNTCSFKVTVGPATECVLRAELLSITPTQLKLEWDCGGTLEAADDVEGPWSEVLGATSPHLLTADGDRRFFRIKLDSAAVLRGQ